MSSLLRVALYSLPLMLGAIVAAAAEEPSPDEKAIQDAAVKFVDAYNTKDVAAITALFDPKARLEEADGTVIDGENAIRDAFTATFGAEPTEQISLEMNSLTLITPEVAVEEGAMQLFPDGETLTSRGRYIVVHQKKDGTWRMISARSLENEVVSNYEYLRQLEWLLGDWIDEDINETVETTCQWDENRNFLIQEFQVRRGTEVLVKGSQRLGWDPQKKEIRGWIFDSTGGFAESRWVDSGDGWMVTSSGTSPKGDNLSDTRTLVPAEDSIAVRMTNRLSGGESLPDLEFTMVRRPPLPASATTPAAQ